VIIQIAASARLKEYSFIKIINIALANKYINAAKHYV
jgi:hypothetical protein